MTGWYQIQLIIIVDGLPCKDVQNKKQKYVIENIEVIRNRPEKKKPQADKTDEIKELKRIPNFSVFRSPLQWYHVV